MGILLRVPDHYLSGAKALLHIVAVKHLARLDRLFRKTHRRHGGSSSGIRSLSGETCESLVGFGHGPATTGLPATLLLPATNHRHSNLMPSTVSLALLREP